MINRKKRYFQWIGGNEETMGDICILESISEYDGAIFFNFEDDSCNAEFISPITNNIRDLKGKLMVEIESPSNPWTIEEVKAKIYNDKSMDGETVEVPTLHDILQAKGQTANVKSNLGTKSLVPPKKQQIPKPLPTIQEYSPTPAVEPAPVEAPSRVIAAEVDNTVPAVDPHQAEIDRIKKMAIENDVEEPKPRKRDAFDPVRILIDSCKKHTTDIDMTLTIDLPSKSIYAMAESEFENGGEKFIENIISDISTKEILKQLKVALKEVYCCENQD